MEQTAHEEYCRRQRTRADAHLARFLQSTPGCSVNGGRADWMKGTHLVTFGSYNGKPAVFKYYDGDPRKGHEKRALQLFAATGLVPGILAETDLMLVMERLPGLTIDRMENDLEPDDWSRVYFRLGEAVAKIVETAPGNEAASRGSRHFRAAEQGDFYGASYDDLTELYREADTTTFFDTTIMRAGRVLHDREVPRKESLQRSLDGLARNRDAILSYPAFVQMDDFHTNNIMTDGRNITGFIDLEMTRSGNEVLLLGAAAGNISHWPDRWAPFRRGYETARGRAMGNDLLSLMRIAAPFSTWIRFTWYLSIDGLPWWAKEGNLALSTVGSLDDMIRRVSGMAL